MPDNTALLTALKDMLHEFVDADVPLDRQFTSASTLKTVEAAQRAVRQAEANRAAPTAPPTDGRFYANGRTVRVAASLTEHEDGGRSMTMDAPVLHLADGLADEAAATVASMMNSARFQDRVKTWLLEAFGPEIAADREERNHRFLEEALELVQACGCTAEEARQLVDYVFARPVGERDQEVGGVRVTLAALCQAWNLDIQECGETELARIEQPDIMAKIRAKQAAKPQFSPLPA